MEKPSYKTKKAVKKQVTTPTKQRVLFEQRKRLSPTEIKYYTTLGMQYQRFYNVIRKRFNKKATYVHAKPGEIAFENYLNVAWILTKYKLDFHTFTDIQYQVLDSYPNLKNRRFFYPISVIGSDKSEQRLTDWFKKHCIDPVHKTIEITDDHKKTSLKNNEAYRKAYRRLKHRSANKFQEVYVQEIERFKLGYVTEKTLDLCVRFRSAE